MAMRLGVLLAVVRSCCCTKALQVDDEQLLLMLCGQSPAALWQVRSTLKDAFTWFPGHAQFMRNLYVVLFVPSEIEVQCERWTIGLCLNSFADVVLFMLVFCYSLASVADAESSCPKHSPMVI